MPVSSSTVTTQIVLVPRHPRVLDLLHDHVAGVGLRVGRRQDQVAVGGRVAARLAQHPQAQVVAGVACRRASCRTSSRPGTSEHAADDHPAGLAAGVGVDRRDRPGPTRSRSGIAVMRLAPARESAISRSRSRRASRSAMSRRRSWSCLPRARPSSTLARPRSLMYSRSGHDRQALGLGLDRAARRSGGGGGAACASASARGCSGCRLLVRRDVGADRARPRRARRARRRRPGSPCRRGWT